MTRESDLGMLLHALPLDSEMWSEQMLLLPDKTYSPNLYEFGDSIEVWAERSLAVSKSKRLIVVGCSVGGSCALEIARLAPERVAALVLIGTKTGHDPNPDLYASSISCVKNHGVEAAWEAYWEPLFLGSRGEWAAPLAKALALRQSAQNLMNGLSAFHTRPSRDDFVAKCNIPIHVVTGEHDTLPGITYCRDLAATAKCGHLHVIGSSGHYVPMVKPRELNALLSDIIEKHSTR